ncbi:P-loop containing nucleoside triphosphate hydrolase protein [Backusella circina FSU 941]|nr:P-loop containing nucleoside triphosphate hydrolase protein [Backusella circina FSU 941]
MPPNLKRSNEDAEEPRSKRTRTLGDDHPVNGHQEDEDEDIGGDEDMPLMPADSSIEVAECGTISRVELHNFMCHKYLKVDFGPKINFVIGHNGSGKSAILTAITVALGAAAHSTNRGKNLGSLIKEGTDSALVIIYLTNRGDSPFRPDIYPDHIRIERRINKDGGSGYKIKNASNRVISTKREDLVAICDHMALLVSNPLTMLTQDMARKFLSDSTSSDKYKLFMQGTQLTQLQTDYDEIRESLDTIRTTIKRKKRVLPQLQEAAVRAKERYNDSQAMLHADEEIDALNSELVWAQIIAKEKETKDAETAYLECESKMNESKDIVQEKQDRVNRLDGLIQQTKEEWQAYKDQPDSFAEEKLGLENQRRVIGSELRGFQEDMDQINSDVKRFNLQKRQHEKKLAEETAKLEASSRVKRDAVLAQMDELKQKLEDRKLKVSQCESEVEENESRQKELSAQRYDLQDKITAINRRLQDIQRQNEGLEKQKKDSLLAFGDSVPAILKDIDKETRWVKRKPIGPMGKYVQLKYMQYANVLETVLGNTLNAFLVESFEDRKLLAEILRRHRSERTMILVSRYDLFDYSEGEPDEKFVTILRALTFKDEWVKRQFIISNSIEQFILMEDRAEADRVMIKKPRNVKQCFTAGLHSVGGKTGIRTDSVTPYRGRRRFERDPTKQIRMNQEEKEELEKQKKSYEADLNLLQSEIRQKAANTNQAKDLQANSQRDIVKIERAIARHEESLKEEEPADVEYFQEAIKEVDTKIEGLKIQFVDITNQLNAKKMEAHDLKKKLKVIENKEEARDRGSEDFKIKIQKMNTKRMEYHNEVEQNILVQKKLRLRLENVKTEYLAQQKVLQEWIEESREDYPDRIETSRTPKEVEKSLTHYRMLIEAKEKELGGSLEDIDRETNETMRAWNDAKTSIEYVEKLARSLQKILEQRVGRWETFRNFISLNARAYFRFYLHKRGDSGNLKFNHRDQTLEIRVSTGDQFKKGGSRQKDSRSLSGGEKSFSQISLLLSLWQSINSPVICLDEFDVFMDAVNRKQTMKLIMDAASDNSSQYILITPQDASNMVPGPYVTIHRMRDPERHS